MIKADLHKNRFINCEFIDCEWTPDHLKSRHWNYDKPEVEQLSDDELAALSY